MKIIGIGLVAVSVFLCIKSFQLYVLSTVPNDVATGFVLMILAGISINSTAWYFRKYVNKEDELQ